MSTQVQSIFTKICHLAAEKKASQIYFLPGQLPAIRINGVLESLNNQNIISTSFAKDLVDTLLNDEEKKELDEKHQVEVVKKVERIGNVQIDVYFARGLPCFRIELLKQEIPDLSSLNTPSLVNDILQKEQGIVFVTGDMGRYELMSSILNNINKKKTNFIATLEKPIKTIISSNQSMIEQREVGRDVASFEKGLEFVRERDPDVLMISQIDNSYIMDQLFAIAESGVLVFALFDSAGAVKTIKRILHFYPTDKSEHVRYFLSENLAGSITARQVPKIGGGRIRAYEVLTGSSAVKSNLASGKFHRLSGMMHTVGEQTAMSLDQHLASLVKQGKIMSEQAFKYCDDKESLRSMLSR